MKENRRRVAAYCRVSTRLEAQEDSLRAQCEWFEYKYGAELAGAYFDDRSGTDVSHRPGLMALLAACEAGDVDMVVTKSVSRFSRNMADLLAIVRRLQALGIPLLFESEQINTMEAGGEMILSALAAVAQEEVNLISSNLAWSVRRRDAEGRPDYRVSYGYRKDADTRAWYVHEAEAERVRAAFRMAAEGARYRELSERMAELERAAPTGASWNQRRLHYVLTNVHYIGDVITQKTYIPDYLIHRRVRNRGALDRYYLQDHHPAIVSRELFASVGARIAAGMLRSERRGGGRGR